MKKDEFKKIFGSLIALYPNANISIETIRAYWGRLKDYDADVLNSAMVRASDESEFFPTIAMIKRLIIDETFDIPTEADVINDLFGAISGYGIYSNPKFIYPITNALVEELGWQTINNMTPENVNKAIHFRYEKVAKHYERCLVRNEPFPINKIKGIFALQEGRKTIVQKGSVSLNELLMEVKNSMPDKIRLLNGGKDD